MGLLAIDDVKLDGEGGREVERLATRIIEEDIVYRRKRIQSKVVKLKEKEVKRQEWRDAE